ncbi:hypothetical protein BD410DRAFT_779543 [Rickenella mellea]|uniref:Uncharacterized protein n=1 Tax=Rickenella mellea TaxID=50990 RepID=A0A4R5XDQ9_9AGAM|nr:hypothetical protein BD410DRAFT_779543 [Rickenella mellea]
MRGFPTLEARILTIFSLVVLITLSFITIQNAGLSSPAQADILFKRARTFPTNSSSSPTPTPSPSPSPSPTPDAPPPPPPPPPPTTSSSSTPVATRSPPPPPPSPSTTPTSSNPTTPSSSSTTSTTGTGTTSSQTTSLALNATPLSTGTPGVTALFTGPTPPPSTPTVAPTDSSTDSDAPEETGSTAGAATSKGFLKNTSAVASTFSIVGLVVLGAAFGTYKYLKKKRDRMDLDLFEDEFGIGQHAHGNHKHDSHEQSMSEATMEPLAHASPSSYPDRGTHFGHSQSAGNGTSQAQTTQSAPKSSYNSSQSAQDASQGYNGQNGAQSNAQSGYNGTHSQTATNGQNTGYGNSQSGYNSASQGQSSFNGAQGNAQSGYGASHAQTASNGQNAGLGNSQSGYNAGSQSQTVYGQTANGQTTYLHTPSAGIPHTRSGSSLPASRESLPSTYSQEMPHMDELLAYPPVIGGEGNRDSVASNHAGFGAFGAPPVADPFNNGATRTPYSEPALPEHRSVDLGQGAYQVATRAEAKGKGRVM